MATRDPARTERLCRLIDARLLAIGMTAAQASQAAGLHADAIRNIERGSVPNSDTLISLSKILKTPASALLDALDRDIVARERDIAGADRHPPATQTRNPVDPAGAQDRDAGGAKLRLVRWRDAKDGGDGMDADVTLIDRPRELAGRDEAYGVYVDDDANAPLIRAGHVAFVDPSRPISTGHPVRAQRRDGAPVIGVLDARDETGITIALGAGGRIHISATALIRLDRIVGFNLVVG